jgi:hypothetical protein
MSAQTLHAPHDDPGQQATAPHDYGEVLHDLIIMGTDLARLLHQQAAVQAAQQAVAPAQQATEAQPAPTPAPDPLVSTVAAFDRTARGVRRGVLLARSLAGPVQPAHDPSRDRAAIRKRILREVEDTIQRPGAGNERDSDGSDDAGLHAELRDRLDAPDLDDDITSRPVADIITEICRDLGLDAHPGTRPFKRRTPDDIRQLCARAAAPSAARQPGAGPQGPRQNATQCAPEPATPAAVPRAQPDPVQARSILPDDPADMIATILRHATRADARWPPPSG